MFIRFAIPCLLLAVAISASPLTIPIALNVDQLHSDIKYLIPQEVIDFYNGLTKEDKAVINELEQQAKSFKTEEDAMRALRSKNRVLYYKAKALYNLLKRKVNGLDTEAKTFVTESFASVRALRPAKGESFNIPKVRETTLNIINGCEALSDAAKADLNRQFPHLIDLVRTYHIQLLVKSNFQDD